MRYLLLAALIASGNAQAVAVTNGGFESNFTGWTVSQTSLCAKASTVAPHSGAKNLNVNGCTAAVSQTLTDLTIGENYTLSYWLKQSYLGGSPSFSVSLGDAVLATVTTQAAFDWTLFEVDAVAAATSETLRFSLSGIRDFSAWNLDDISIVAAPLPPVSPIPEPETLALMAAGLAAVGFVSRRRK